MDTIRECDTTRDYAVQIADSARAVSALGAPFTVRITSNYVSQSFSYVSQSFSTESEETCVALAAKRDQALGSVALFNCSTSEWKEVATWTPFNSTPCEKYIPMSVTYGGLFTAADNWSN
jgi:hypothetical protein